MASVGDGAVGNPLHIAHAVLSLDVGGLERIVLDLVRISVRRGDRVSVICVANEGDLAPLVKEAGATVHCLHKPPGKHPHIRPFAASMLASLRPDVIHTHQIGPAWYLGPLAHACQIPLIHTQHGDQFAREKSPLQRLRHRVFYHRASHWISLFCCVSPALADVMRAYRTIPKNRIDVVLNGIQTELPTGMSSPAELRTRWSIPLDAKVMGTVARLDEVKRQDLMIDAFSHVVREHPSFHLLIVGDGPERGKLERQTENLGLSTQVHFTGFQNQPEAYYRAMDMFALSSRSEGLPVSLLEAWNAGLPTVCTAVGGIPDVVTHGVNGRLVPPGDVQAMVRAIRFFLREPAKAQQVGLRGRAKVLDSYSLDRMADNYRNRYETSLAVLRDRGAV